MSERAPSGHGQVLSLPATAPDPARTEAERLAALRRYDILDTPPDGAFDRVAAMAARWFDAPVATVAIVDADRIWFKAAHGLDGVTQIGRDPGLCASAILRDDALVIADTLTDPVACANPLVAGAMGVRFYAAAPIITPDGHRLGTVNVLDTKPRQITDVDTAMLADLAAIVADQLEVRLSALRLLRAERELRVQSELDKLELEEFAGTLQRTLLPPSLPDIPGMELASHYQTASPREVGGDFYDVFALDERRWAFFLGDVCGKGAQAAAVTSLVRYTLRAAALHDPDPVAVLDRLNTALLLDPDHGGRFCTAVFGTITPADGGGFAVHLGTGGHPTVMRLHADDPAPGGQGRARVEPLSIGNGMLVGALEEASFVAAHLHLPPGDGLLLYTDGLTEGTTGDQDGFGGMLGEDGLVEHLNRMLDRQPDRAKTHPEVVSAPNIVQGTAALLDTFTGNDDDVALLAMAALPATGSTAPPQGSSTGASVGDAPDRTGQADRSRRVEQ